MVELVSVVRFDEEIPLGETARCAPRLPVNENGDIACTVTRLTAPGDCDCYAPGLGPLTPQASNTVFDTALESGYCGPTTPVPNCSDLCACEVLPATGDSLNECLEAVEPAEDAVGWCYIDSEHGNPELIARCANDTQQRIRLLGPAAGDYTFILSCAGSLTPKGRAVGDPCVPEDELNPNFAGYVIDQSTLDLNSPSCGSGVCLVNHFQGRVTCPYGQTVPEGSDTCHVPGTDTRVVGPVAPQLVDRRADLAVTCTCRCDGPGEGPFCSCPSGTECREVLSSLGLPGEEAYVGSYCIPEGAMYDATNPLSPEACLSSAQNCE